MYLFLPFRMEKTTIFLVFVLISLCCCYEPYNNPYDDEYEGDAVIDGILSTYRHDPDYEPDSYRKTEQYLNDQPTRETISMPGVSPQKVCFTKNIED